MSIHAMVDLESFDHDSYIVQIGACKWNIESGEIKSEFLVNTIPPKEFSTSYDTIRWWFGQNSQAQKSLFDPEPISLEEGLKQFSGWYKNNSRVDGLWSHATSDVPMLQRAYSKLGLNVPWSYRSAKDIRTLNWLAQDLGIDLKTLTPANSTLKHNGLADSIEQAKNVTTVLNKIKEIC